MSLTPEEILSMLPYSEPFLFVDKIGHVDDNSITGTYTFYEDHFFYKGHFRDFPVTPGVILTETMAQIGVVCFGIYLSGITPGSKLPPIAMTSVQIDFLLPVFPGETVTVISEKVFFRMGKLKCNVKMLNSKGQPVCSGIIAGMLKLK